MLRLLVLAAAGFASFAVTLSAMPAFAAQQGASAAAAGSVTTVMLGTTVLSQLGVPALLRKLPTPAVMGLGSLLLGLPMLALFLDSTLPTLLVVAAVRGVGFGLFTVAGAMLTFEVAAPGEHGKVTGRYGLAAGLAIFLFVPLGVQLLQWGGLAGVIAIAAVPSIAVATLGLKSITDDNQREEAPGGNVLRALKSAWAPSVVLAALTLTSGAAFTILPIRLPEGWLATVGLLLIGLAQTIVRWFTGRIADSTDTRVLMSTGCGIAALGILTIGLSLSGPQPWLLMLGCVFVGTGFGAAQTVTLVAAFARAHHGDQALTSTIWNASFDAGTAVGAVLIGALIVSPLGLIGAFAAVAGLCVIMIPVALLPAPVGPTGAAGGESTA